MPSGFKAYGREMRRPEGELVVAVTVTLEFPETWRRQDILKLEKTHLGRSGSPRRAPPPHGSS